MSEAIEVEPEEAGLGVEPEVESLWQTVKGDFASAAGWRVLGVAGLLAWMAFQWGWGNDILLPPIVARAFEAVDDMTTWRSGVAAIGAGIGAGSLFWGLTQAFDAVVVLAGLRLVPGTTARISRFLRRQGWIKPAGELKLGTRFLIAYMSGASVLCLVDAFATGQLGIRVRRRLVVESVVLAVIGVGFVILVVTTAVAVGARVPATATTADVVLRYARNPLTWLVIYGGAVLISTLINKLRPDTSDSV